MVYSRQKDLIWSTPDEYYQYILLDGWLAKSPRNGGWCYTARTLAPSSTTKVEPNYRIDRSRFTVQRYKQS